VLGKLNKYADKEKKYNIAAVAVTISRLGPSGSLKRKNISLEHSIEVMAKIIRELFFELKFILWKARRS